jgi:hypothetical protein
MNTTHGQFANGSMRNARFWTFENDAWVKITLRPDQSLTHRTFSRDDEGFSSTADTWIHEGGAVFNIWGRFGRDCDGRSESAGRLVCAMADLRAVDADQDMPPRPDWQKVGETICRDEFAEAAGY